MTNSFLKYYSFITEIALDRMVLMRTEKKIGESFREYAERWCELAAQVQPPMMENEMIKWFINNLRPPYYEKMINTQVIILLVSSLLGSALTRALGAKRSWMLSL